MKFSYETTQLPSGAYHYAVLRDDTVVTEGYRASNAEATVAAKDDLKLARLFMGEHED